MTVSLKHSFESAKADSSDASLVQPSNWNAEHSLTCAPGILIGRATAGTGNAEEIGLGSGLSFSGGNLVVSGFAASSHTHVIADVTGLQTALDGKQAATGRKAKRQQVLTGQKHKAQHQETGRKEAQQQVQAMVRTCLLLAAIGARRCNGLQQR